MSNQERRIRYCLADMSMFDIDVKYAALVHNQYKMSSFKNCQNIKQNLSITSLLRVVFDLLVII